jgi:sugar (pentulose or hexulose) kinase/phosphoglycerate dehydrogenase-like enzyme/ribulose-5-phosphate 4-epimerase/fuculose-1-phosphate aldolase/putative sterol carrier protein
MAPKFLMSLDLGGSGGRALVYNTQTGESTLTTCTWTFYPDPEVSGFSFDLGCQEKWQALCEIGRKALSKAGAQPQEVAGISVTSMRHGMVLLDKQGQVRIAIPNRDARAYAEGMELQGARGDELYQRTGHIPNPVLLAARLLWMLRHHPEYLESGSVVLTISDWMAYQLCSVIASEPTQAGETCLFDLYSAGWAWDLIAALGLPAGIFPKIVQSGTKLGGLTQAAAQSLGLQAGIPVAAGGADTQLGMLGLGITGPNEIAVIAGSTTPVMATSTVAHIDPEGHTWTGMYPIPGVHVVESNAGNMGASLEWFAKLLYTDSPAPVAALAGDACNSIPGATGIISSLGAQLFNASALGLPVDGLTFSTMTTPTGLAGRSHLARAVLEGMAFSARQNAEQALKVAQTRPERLHLGGGMTRSQLWTQIVSDTFNQPAVVGLGKSASSFGAILCAAVAAGLVPDLPAAVASMVKPVRHISPSAQADAYAELYRGWSNHVGSRSTADEVASGGIMTVLQTSLDTEKPQDTAFSPRIYVSANAGDEAIHMLKDLGDVTYASYAEVGNVLSGDELVETLNGYHVLVTEVDLIDADALQKAQDLRVIVACRGNPVNVDIPACTAAGIPVLNTPGRNSDAVADLAIGFMLMLLRKLGKAAAFLHEPGSEAGDLGRMGQAYFTLKGHELWHKTVGVVGGGAIGQKVIRRLLPFEARVLLYDPYVSSEQAALFGAEKVALDELLARSDIISLHAPANEETTGMIDSSAFDRMKPGVFLINTARAALIDHAALLGALGSGKLGGVALDVFLVEPPGVDDPLLAFENVLATPHIGGNTSEVGIHQGMIIVEELNRLLSGQKPKYALNPETLEGFAWSGARQSNRLRLAELAQGPGPGLTDLDVNAKKAAASIPAEADKPKTDGLLGGLRRLVGGKAKEEPDVGGVSQLGPDASALPPISSPAALAGGAPDFSKFNRIIEHFVTSMRTDPDTLVFAKGKNVTFQYVIKDAGTHFYTGFVNGKVNTGMGDSPDKPDVTIKTDAATLDGMFTGRLDGTAAFKSGKLSVNGNMIKAMVMQKLNYGVLYNQARSEVGDPGDLTLAGSPPAAALAGSLPGSTADSPPQVGVPAIIHKVGDIRDMLLEVNNEMFHHGWITSTGGNVSVRSDQNPEEIWITPSGLFKGSLRADMMVKIDLDGNIIGDAPYNASSERKVHCAIFRLRPEIKAVIHTHAKNAMLMALTGTKWLPISADAAFFGEIPVVPFIMPGSPELGDAVADVVGPKGVAAIMQNHGLVVAGSDLRRAADTTEAIETTAEKLLWCRKMGISPAVIPDEIVQILNEMGSMVA